MFITGQQVGTMLERRSVDNGIGSRERAFGAYHSRPQCDTRIQIHDDAFLGVRDDLIKTVLIGFPRKPLGEFQLHKCRYQAQPSLDESVAVFSIFLTQQVKFAYSDNIHYGPCLQYRRRVATSAAL